MKIFLVIVVLVLLGLFAATQYFSRKVTAEFPPSGNFITVDGVQLHYKEIAAGEDGDLLPMVFIHGASGNLRDLQAPLGNKLRGRGRMIFVDRPGHGFSSRGSADDIATPWAQAKLISRLLKELKIEKAIIVGHSWGGAVAASFGVNHPGQTAGLIFLAPATHPWPGGGVTWYYDVAQLPVVGRLFTELLAIPAGQLRFEDGVKGVFSPNPVPNGYIRQSANQLVLRNDTFRYNAEDVSNLFENVSIISPRYKEITAPTSIITGDSDDVVLANIHSIGLERDIKGAKLIWLKGVGHAPHWINPEVVIEEIERISALQN